MSECEHLRPGTCVGWSPWHRCASKVDGLCTGCPNSTSDSEPEHWEWDLGKAGSYCLRVLEPPLSTQPIVPPQPELPSQELPSQPRRSCQRCHLTRCDSSFTHSFRPMQRGTIARKQHLGQEQQRSSNVAGSQAVGSRCSGTEPPREEIACASSPLGTHHGREGYDPGGHCGTARPWRDGARTEAGAGASGPALANTASSSALRRVADGATAAVVSTEHKVASVLRNNFPLHFTSLPYHHLTSLLPCTQLFKFLTPSCAVYHVSLGIASALSGLGSVPKCRGRTNSTGRMGQHQRPVSIPSWCTPHAAVKEYRSRAVQRTMRLSQQSQTPGAAARRVGAVQPSARAGQCCRED